MKETTSKFYSISEFAELVGITPYTLRYYENEGLVKPKRDLNGRRYYDEEDQKWVSFLLHLKGTGMSIMQLKEYVKLRAAGDVTITARLALLQKVKAKCLNEIAQIEENLAILDHKMAWYQGRLLGEIADDENFERYLEKFK